MNAVLIDWGFLRYKINYLRLDPIQTSSLIGQYSDYITKKLVSTLYRTFLYTSEPVNNTIHNPISQKTTYLGKSDTFKNEKKFLEEIIKIKNLALRLGKLNIPKNNQWKLVGNPPRDFILKADSIKPNVIQKGVDMNIGMDIASLSLKK